MAGGRGRVASGHGFHGPADDRRDQVHGADIRVPLGRRRIDGQNLAREDAASAAGAHAACPAA